MNKKLILFSSFLVIFSSFLIPKNFLFVSAANCKGLDVRKRCYQATDEKGANEATICYDGLVPCGKYVDKHYKDNNNDKCDEIYINCQLCHFFIMLNEIINFVVNDLVPPIAVLLIVYAGILIYFGGESSKMLSSGKNIIKYVAIGLFFIYGSFMLVGELLNILGATSQSPLQGIWTGRGIQINCTPTYH